VLSLKEDTGGDFSPKTFGFRAKITTSAPPAPKLVYHKNLTSKPKISICTV